MSALRKREPMLLEQGSASVELVFVLPALLLLLAFIAEMGMVFFQYNILLESANSGARYAAAYADFSSATPLADVSTDAENLVKCGTVNACSSANYLLSQFDARGSVNIAQLSPDVAGMYHVKLIATYNHPLLFSWYLPACSASCDIPLTVTVLMRGR